MRRWRRSLRALIVLQIIALVLWMALAYDHPIRLAIRFNLNVFRATLSSPFQDVGWLNAPPAFPVVLPDDVALVMKSGFGTRDRIPAWLEAHQNRGLSNVLLVADFGGQFFSYDGQRLPVHDMIAEMKEEGSIPNFAHPRLLKYADLSAAIFSDDVYAAKSLSSHFGWELDAMKFISALELCYYQMPKKKWYLLVDDDTYLIQPSLKLLLERLDPSVPYYIGNAVGDYKGRFAHGGSGIVLSHSAMHQLFSHPQVVSAAHHESFQETWGDKLLATTLMKLGIYLDETYTNFFNGEPLRMTKITAQRFCAPIISFHALSSPLLMERVGEIFRNTADRVRWIDLWNICEAPPLDSPVWEAGRDNWDHVGKLDEATMTVSDVRSAKDCVRVCHNHANTCLAWTWKSASESCHISPWMIPGVEVYGKVSGINTPRAKSLANRC